MLSETLSANWRRARAVNQTSTSFVAKTGTLATPSGDAGTATGASIIECGNGGAVTENSLQVQPFGVGSNAQTFSVRVLGWTLVLSTATDGSRQHEWRTTLLAEVLCTLDSSSAGIAGGEVGGTTQYFCNALSVTYGNPNVSIDCPPSSAAGCAIAFTIDIKGAQKVELTFSTGSSATSCNALVRKM